MNNMTTAQANKFVYLCGIVLLLIPIIWLGLPSDGNAGSGGKLSQLRTRYELGESDLGDIDPSGAAMNLVLLGMRGVAVNLLWIDLDNQKNMKRWSEMQAVTESIVRLQPHFDKIWEFNGWNLAYNTSAEWDAVPDRYFWVKAGGKFIKRGVDRNRKSTHLQYHLGNIYQKKIGIADESKYYRKYFLRDPDPKFNNGPDRDFNPDEMDNYLVAKKTFLLAIVKEQTNPQHILDISLFKTSPARCQFDYAVALQKDGLFGEQTREAWQDALNDWTLKYGREFFQVKIQDQVQSIQMEMTRPEIKAVAKSPDDVPKIAAMIEHYRKMVNYYYWRTRGTIESERETSEAHRDLYEGAQLYKKQELAKAQESLLSGMEKMESLLKRKGNESLVDENDLNEECLLGVLIWIDIHRLVGEQIPERFPLDWLKAKMEGNAETMNKVNRRLRLLVE
jgi:hypothetical protein